MPASQTRRATTAAANEPDSSAPRGAGEQGLRRRGPLCLCLALVTLAVYLPTARNDFVNYDDSDYVTENRHVKAGLTLETASWAFKTRHASNWHPLTWLSHALDCQLFGVNAPPMHLVSALLHAANTVLLFLVLRGLTGALWRSALVAALFGLHPLHVESVAWISERKDLLSGLFFLLTIWAYGRYAQGRRPKAEDREKPEARSPKPEQPAHEAADHATPSTLHAWRYYALALLSYALGLMSKPMLVTTPFVLLLLDYWPLGRLASLEPQVQGLKSAQPATRNTGDAPCIPEHTRKSYNAIRILLEKVPFLALSIGSSIVTFRVQRAGGAVSTVLTFGQHIANALVSYGRYVRKMFWPDDLSVLYPHPGHWPWWQVLACAALLAAVTVLVALTRRTRPYLLVGWLWFLGTLVPVIGLVQVGIQSMADRYTYIPLIGLFIMLVWGLGELAAARLPADLRRSAPTAAAGLALAGCAVMTFRQVHYWQNTETLFRRAVQVTKDNYLAHNNLGFYYSAKGRKAEAMQEYQLSLKINPSYEDALNNLGYALAGERKFTEAIPLYEAALRTRPKNAEVNNNLGNALSETGKLDDAIRHYLIALEQNPEHADAHNNLGIALCMKGKLDEAIPHFQAAIRYKPDYASAHSNLGNALAAQHKLDDAIKEYQVCLRLKPDDPQGHNNLGNALMEKGRTDEAMRQYEEALRLNPDNNPEANYNLALALVRQGKREEAIRHLEAALRAKPDYPEVRRELQLLSAPQPPRAEPSR